MATPRRTREWELPDGSMPMHWAACQVKNSRPRPIQLPRRQKATTRDALNAIESALPIRREVEDRKRLLDGARRGRQTAIDALWQRYRLRLTMGP